MLVTTKSVWTVWDCKPQCAAKGTVELALGLDLGDNASVATVFKTLRPELVWRHPWHTRSQVTEALFKYVNGFYNTRRHSAPGGKPPAQSETKMRNGIVARPKSYFKYSSAEKILT
jgi:hypothetical protein